MFKPFNRIEPVAESDMKEIKTAIEKSLVLAENTQFSLCVLEQ